MEIADRIKELRRKKGISQKDLAKKLGTSPQNLAQYESGKRQPKIETLEKIASALGVGASALMGVEYYDKKYPDLAQASKEYEGFIDYLNSLGYIINDIYFPSQIPIEELEKAGKMDIVPEECKESDFVLGESHSVEFIKDGKSFILEDDEFEDLQKSTKDMIALKLWQKSQDKK